MDERRKPRRITRPAAPAVAARVRRVHVRTAEAPGGVGVRRPRGGLLRRNDFATKVWQPAAPAAGLPQGSHPHALRGWRATMAGRARPPGKLMHRLGHASPAMALRYQRAEQERDAILAAAMSAALRQS